MSLKKTLLLAAVVLAGCSRSDRPRDLRNANVLLITLDTTRADHIGAYGSANAQTPNLDRLASQGLLFEQCITPSGYTLPSHSSIMTGLYPPAHGVRLNGDAALADEQNTLAEALSAKGYRTGGFVGAFVLDGRWGISQGFQHYDDKFQLGADQKLDLQRVQRPANQVVDAALHWLGQESAKPFFAWVHMYDAHTPYEPPEPFRSRFQGPTAAYDGEISFADSQVGRLLEWIEKRGLRENTIVIVTADHGEGLGSHGEEEHGYYVYDYSVRVPLIVRVPGLTGRRIAAQVRTVDILPTVLDLLGAERAARLDGESLLTILGAERPPVRYAYSESVATKLQYGWAGLYSLRTTEHKFIEAPRSELYELKRDPDETTNRLDDLRRVARDLKTRLAAIREEAIQRAPKAQEANLDSETLAKLASLGYLSGGRGAESLDERGLADPKDKMHLFDSIGYAGNLMAKEDFKGAADVLEIVLKDDPGIPQAQLLVVSAYRKTGRTDKARAILDANLKKDPGNVHALIAMAEILSQENRSDDVLAICRTALAKDARNARAYELIADVYMKRNDPRAAVPNLQKAVEIQPKLSRSRNNLAAALIGTGQLAEAETLLTKILAEQPKFPLANYHLGLLREQQRRLPEARAAYEAELKNQPKSVVARFNLGNLMLRTGDEQGAEQQMRILIEQDPEGARPYLMLARILLNRGKLEEVERLAQAGLSRARQPDLQALGWFLLADVYSREGRRAELQEAVRKGQYYRARIGAS
jgi:arylsulfatase A-like enzyme/Tfp pilus assembly protein PilF